MHMIRRTKLFAKLRTAMQHLVRHKYEYYSSRGNTFSTRSPLCAYGSVKTIYAFTSTSKRSLYFRTKRYLQQYTVVQRSTCDEVGGDKPPENKYGRYRMRMISGIFTVTC